MGELLLLAGQLDGHQRGHAWLLAYERHYREQIFAALAANYGRTRPNEAPGAQLVFCMDDREEGTRRHLEEINPDGRDLRRRRFLRRAPSSATPSTTG